MTESRWIRNPFLWGLAALNDVSIQAVARLFDVEIPSLVSESDQMVTPGILIAVAIAQLACLLFFVRTEQEKRNAAWVEQRFLLPYFGLSIVVGLTALVLVYLVPGVLGGALRPWIQGATVALALGVQWVGSMVIARTGRLRAVFAQAGQVFGSLPKNERLMVVLFCAIAGALQALLDGGLDLGGAAFALIALTGFALEVGLLRLFVLRL